MEGKHPLTTRRIWERVPNIKNDMPQVHREALYRLLRPLARVMLRHGMAYGSFAELARKAFVDECFASLRGSDGVGDYLEVEAIDVRGTLVATRVDRDDDVDEAEIQAPVPSFVEGVSVTLLGLTFDVTGTDFENVAEARGVRAR